MLTKAEIAYMAYLATSTYVGLQMTQQPQNISNAVRFFWFVSFILANHLIKEFAGPFNPYVYSAGIITVVAPLMVKFFRSNAQQ